ncbi:MAG: YdeI/OmpD-associated family protein [Ekhidna sp.]|nr:YdeI/OmpD-associated family protein [Ekhidna sp.]
MKESKEICPINQEAWREWLSSNHDQEDAVWLIYFKKNSPKHNLSWSDAVDEALCFGWIDSVIRKIDADSYKQYFTKRKPKSNWSKVNKDKVKNLIDQGLMQQAGYQSIQIAKENGSWNNLDAVEALIIPEDLKLEFSNYEGSFEYFISLSDSSKKILLYWVISAKRPETRRKRVLEIAQNASNSTKPKPFR